MTKFRMLESKAESINLVLEQNQKDGFDFSFDVGFLEANDKAFFIKFRATVTSTSGYTLKVVFCSFFEADDALTDDFKGSHFLSTNAPAIAYPFLRSFIAIVILNSGYEPVLVPTINFQALSEQRASKKAEPSLKID